MKMIRQQNNGEDLEGLRRLDLFDRLTKRDASQFRGQNRPSIRRNHGEEKRPAGDFPAPIVRHRVSPNLVGWVESSEPTRTRLDWNATGWLAGPQCSVCYTVGWVPKTPPTLQRLNRQPLISLHTAKRVRYPPYPPPPPSADPATGTRRAARL